MIAFLLAKYVHRMSPEQRAEIESAMKDPPSVDIAAVLNINRTEAGKEAAVALPTRAPSTGSFTPPY
jgi:hypothetical protein